MTDGLAQGKFAICLGCKDTPRAKSHGLPVDSFNTNAWKESGAITSSPGTVGLINRAPHPNAAKVLINWLLSREGQIAVQKLGDPSDPSNSRRTDIPKDEIAPHLRRLDGRNLSRHRRPRALRHEAGAAAHQRSRRKLIACLGAATAPIHAWREFTGDSQKSCSCPRVRAEN